jgi:hypothetical protein
MKAVTSRQLVQYESPYRKKAFSKGGLWTSKRRKESLEQEAARIETG